MERAGGIAAKRNGRAAIFKSNSSTVRKNDANFFPLQSERIGRLLIVDVILVIVVVVRTKGGRFGDGRNGHPGMLSPGCGEPSLSGACTLSGKCAAAEKGPEMRSANFCC